jgi:small subunit ribosomal protein S1
MGKFRFIDLEDEDVVEGSGSQTEAAGMPMQDSFASLLEQEGSGAGTKFRDPRKTQKVSGVVIQRGKEVIFVDIGAKQPGVISLGEFLEVPIPANGDTIELFVKDVSSSEIILTRTMKSDGINVDELVAAKASGTPVEARIEKVVNGGYQARLGTGAARAFVPFSHMTLGSNSQPTNEAAAKPEDFVGQSFRFQILEVKEGGRNILLSRKGLLREAEDEERRKCLATLVEGETRTATITKLAVFGAFARLGPGIEGLIPLGELGWKRVAKASDAVKESESVQVKIMSITHAPKLRISLSMKDAGTDPWLLLEQRLEAGQQLNGTVTRLSDFGAFVDVAIQGGTDGVATTFLEGLVHVSELSWTKRIRHPSDVLRPGQEGQFFVVRVEAERRRLALSLRGPMPEDIRLRAEAAARRKDGTPTDEEREMASVWQEYQQQQGAVSATEAAGDHPGNKGKAARDPRTPAAATSLAAAFASARQKGDKNP